MNRIPWLLFRRLPITTMSRPTGTATRKPKSSSASSGTGKQTTLLSYFSSPKGNLSTGTGAVDSVSVKRFKLNVDADDMGSKVVTEVFPTPDKPVKRPTSDHVEETVEDSSTHGGVASQGRLLEKSNVLQILDRNMGLTWFEALEPQFSKSYFAQLSEFVTGSRAKGTVFPPADNVWEWTKQYPIQDVKVVILGQDPYHGPNQAHGLCFSVKKGVALPPSLQNMYKELENENIGFVRPNHGCLTGWSEQGVLLLNAVLTVDAHKANSHKDKGWENITDGVISWISNNLNSVVFLLWGAYAQKKAAMVDKSKHHLLECPHPSPFSASRGFFGCNHFSKCNELLEKSGKKPIDWNHLP